MKQGATVEHLNWLFMLCFDVTSLTQQVEKVRSLPCEVEF